MGKNRTEIITLRVTEELKNSIIKCAFLKFGEEGRFTTMNDFLNHIIQDYVKESLPNE